MPNLFRNKRVKWIGNNWRRFSFLFQTLSLVESKELENYILYIMRTFDQLTSLVLIDKISIDD